MILAAVPPKRTRAARKYAAVVCANLCVPKTSSTWVHLRSTNPIESTFATVRHRTKVTKGPGSRAAGLAMAFKLIEAAQDRWRAVNAPHLVALVRAGAIFINGKLVERADDAAA